MLDQSTGSCNLHNSTGTSHARGRLRRPRVGPSCGFLPLGPGKPFPSLGLFRPKESKKRSFWPLLGSRTFPLLSYLN